MKMEPLKGGCLKIWMSETDMQHWGLQFDRMDARDEATRRAVLRLIHVARERLAFRADDQLTVEVLPLEDGCLLLLTPMRAPSWFRLPQPAVYLIRSADDLLRLGDSLCHIPTDSLPPTSLFAWGEAYHLIVYPDTVSLLRLRRLLHEFAAPIAVGYPAAAHTEEYGKPLVIGDALHRLCVTAPESP